DGGMGNAHRDVPLHQIRCGELLPVDGLARIGFGRHQRTKTLHVFPAALSLATAHWLGHRSEAVELPVQVGVLIRGSLSCCRKGHLSQNDPTSPPLVRNCNRWSAQGSRAIFRAHTVRLEFIATRTKVYCRLPRLSDRLSLDQRPG